jgi:CBS domain-containing protein
MDEDIEERIALPRGKREMSILEKKLEEILVSDVMHKGLIVVDSNESIENAARMMKENKIGSVIVMEKGKGIGILTERDIVRRVVSAGLSTKKKVKEVMSTPLRTIKESDSIDKAISVMRKYKIKKLPVTDKKGRLIGIITETEIIHTLPGVMDVLFELTGASKIQLTTEGVGICDRCGLYSESLTNVGGELLCEECLAEEEK